MPDLGELVEIQVADHDFLVLVRRDIADELPARVDEIRLSVEIVVTERLDPAPIDRADVILVRHGSRRLFQLPQVFREPPAGGRRVEYYLRAGQTQSAPPLREM